MEEKNDTVSTPETQKKKKNNNKNTINTEGDVSSPVVNSEDKKVGKVAQKKK